MGSHPVSKALRLSIAGFLLLLTVLYLPTKPYVPNCIWRAWFYWPPRMHPSAIREVSWLLHNGGWRHIVVAGRVLVSPLQWEGLDYTDVLNHRQDPRPVSWRQWEVDVERTVVSWMVYGQRWTDHTAVERPEALRSVVEATDRRWRFTVDSIARDATLPDWNQHTRHGSCLVLRAALFDQDIDAQHALCRQERQPHLGWCTP